MKLNPLNDKQFLIALDKENVKTFYANILVLDKDENPMSSIQGRISSGSISIDGNSSVRRSGSLTFLAEETKNDLTDVDNLLSMNKKIKLLIGMENHINDMYDDIIWFNQGVYVITQPSLSHGTGGVTISLQLKDKMCLLNGDCGGGLPASVTFHEYDQRIGYDDNDYENGYTTFPQKPNNYTVYLVNGDTYMWSEEHGWEKCNKDEKINTTVSVPQLIFDIIQTSVCRYGGESIDKIIIEDVPLEIKQTVRYVGHDTLYYDAENEKYSTSLETEDAKNCSTYNYNEDCGYIYTSFTYPGQLVSNIGDNVCSILDKIKNQFNYEYFYDIDGNFIFREIKNYLNNQYEPVQTLRQDSYILNNETCKVEYVNSDYSIYNFEEGSSLITSYSNTPSYTNIKNDFHVWGKNTDGLSIHYHLAIKAKPVGPFTARNVVYVKDPITKEYTGQIRLAKDEDFKSKTPIVVGYTPEDWRAELYLLGLEKQAIGVRPDAYETEILNLFDSIYNMKDKQFKADLTNNPNELNYWIDFLEPYGDFHNISIDAIGPRVYSMQKDSIKKLYDTDKPDVIMIDLSFADAEKERIRNKCILTGQTYSNVNKQIYDNIAIGSLGYTAQETMRDILYKYTEFLSSISISSIPLYYLEPNRIVSVQDRASGICGDYVIKTISLPLDARNTMSITASAALTRI